MAVVVGVMGSSRVRADSDEGSYVGEDYMEELSTSGIDLQNRIAQDRWRLKE
jgi:hypothetical protein